MTRFDELRLMTKVARMYYEQDLRQPEIAQKLEISQATISRLLKRAREENIVRLVINVPNGVFPELEDELQKKYGLEDAVVVDCENEENEELIQRDIGAAAAYYVESRIQDNEIIGLSSWSSTLLALVDAMHPLPGRSGVQVVQILGGIGNPSAEVHATRLTGRFASLVNGTPVFLPAPGIVGSEAALQVLLEDQFVQEAIKLFNHVTMALVGIGDVKPSKLLTLSGNIFSNEELKYLQENGAVGDILLHFFDANGNPVQSTLDKRVVSMSLEQLKRIKRSIAVAGGKRKFDAICGAIRGGWVNVLITDRGTAERLIKANRETS